MVGQFCDYIKIHVLWPMAWLGGQELGKQHDWKISDKEI